MPIGRYYKRGQLISEEYFELHETQKDLEDNFNREQNGTTLKAEIKGTDIPYHLMIVERI